MIYYYFSIVAPPPPKKKKKKIFLALSHARSRRQPTALMQFHAKAREKGHQKCNTYSLLRIYTSTLLANSNNASGIHPQQRTYYIPVLKTYPANKAIGMPLTVQSRYIIFHNGSVTSPTLGCKHIKIIIPTVWFAISFMESFLTKLFPTLGTEKMFSVPSFFECSYTFLERKVK